jgi:hypothetical protein
LSVSHSFQKSQPSTKNSRARLSLVASHHVLIVTSPSPDCKILSIPYYHAHHTPAQSVSAPYYSLSRRARLARKRSQTPDERAFGPSDDRKVLATLFAAAMFAFCASIPRTRVLFPCSYESAIHPSSSSSTTRYFLVSQINQLARLRSRLRSLPLHSVVRNPSQHAPL